MWDLQCNDISPTVGIVLKYTLIKGRRKAVPVRGKKAYSGSIGIALFILYLGAKCRRVVNIIRRPL
jgi:hypothetical protein